MLLNFIMELTELVKVTRSAAVDFSRIWISPHRHSSHGRLLEQCMSDTEHCICCM